MGDFFRGCGFSAGTFASRCPVFHLRVRSNAWFLSYECCAHECAHVLLVMQNSMELNVLNEEIPVNRDQKKISHMSKLVETMFIILKC